MSRKLSELGRQLLGVWKQLGLNQRITVVCAAVGVLAALVALAFWSGRPDYALLYGRLDEAEAGRITGVLEEAKVPYRVSQAGGAIYVPRDQVYPMRMQLASRGIPRGEGVGFEIFDKPNFGISDFVQRANYLRAVQGELARTISQLDEVEASRVMIVIPENRLLVDEHKRPTASVFVRTSVDLAAPAVTAIRSLVANAVEGLQPGQVTVVDNRGRVLSENMETDSMAGLTSTQLAARRNLEQYLARKAEGMLDAVLGPGQSVVRVSADINFDSTTKTEEKFDPESQVVRTSTINDETTDSTTADGGGPAGVVPNITVDTNLTANAPVNNSRLRKKTVNNEYEINRIVSSVTQAAGGIQRLSAAVFVASRLEGLGADRKPVPRSQEELDKLRRIVQSALGIQTDSGGITRDEITLEEMPFNQPFAEVAQDLNRQERQQFWFNHLHNLAYLLLALAICYAFWRMIKKTPLDQIPLGVPVGELAPDRRAGGGILPASSEMLGGGRRSTEPVPGVMSVEVFNRLVKENPENMTQAIHDWLAGGRSGRN